MANGLLTSLCLSKMVLQSILLWMSPVTSLNFSNIFFFLNRWTWIRSVSGSIALVSKNSWPHHTWFCKRRFCKRRDLKMQIHQQWAAPRCCSVSIWNDHSWYTVLDNQRVMEAHTAVLWTWWNPDKHFRSVEGKQHLS